ncbi:MAG: PEP-CTERM sorting domain-containing protein, partial [Oceanipulchritudo sp.]
FLVPEPSEIAGMAMLGLLGMLFLRRRLTKK